MCHWRTPCKLLYFIAKRVSHRSRSNRWRDDFMKTQWWRSWWWRSWCHAGDKMIMEPQDGDQRSYMILAISCHYYIIACDVYYVYASCLLRTTVVNKMIPYKNFKKCSPLTVHRCDSSLFQITTWWSGVWFRRSHTTGVRQIYTCNTLRVNLTSLACTDMASEHGDRKVEHESYSRYDQHEDVHRWWLVRLTWWSDTA